MIEQVPPDYITPLRADPNIKIGSGGAYQGFIVFNQLLPAVQQPEGAPGGAARGEPGEVRRRAWATRSTCA